MPYEECVYVEEKESASQFCSIIFCRLWIVHNYSCVWMKLKMYFVVGYYDIVEVETSTIQQEP